MPAFDRASMIFFGLALTSGSTKSKPNKSITAYQPALPASPAAFLINSCIQERLMISQLDPVIIRLAPINSPNKPHPTASFFVRSRARMSKIGPNIITKLRMS